VSRKSPIANLSDKAYVSSVASEREIASLPLVPAMVPSQAKACEGSSVIGVEPEGSCCPVWDGLNLYHAIDKLRMPCLKWLNIWSLAEHLIPRKSQTLVKVVYCTARKQDDDPEKVKRQREFLTALECYGVTTIWSHFIYGEMNCRGCGREWRDPKEKESDVNLALTLIDDAYQNTFDHAYILTADSDQGSTARMMKTRFPYKQLTSITPPGQEKCKAIMAHTGLHIGLTAEHLERNLLPAIRIDDVGGKQTLRFRRPDAYKP